jgi:uncharacterized OsmC-like protein/fermentation-respiration switch protein FrsA (DUF1100 family)
VPSSTCTFTNARDQQLSARLERPVGPIRATAVFAHCFTCSKDLRAARRIASSLRERGIAVLSYDFAGLGSSEGDFAASTFSSDVDDLIAAAGYLAETIAAPSLLVGHSLGGAAVLTAAAQLNSVTAVATIGAPSDVEHVQNLVSEDDRDRIRADGRAAVTIGGRTFNVGASFLDDLSTHALLDTVADLDASLLLLHSPVDNTVGVQNAADLYGAAKHPKSYVSLDDADHLLTDPADARYAAEVIASWADRYLPEPDASASRDDADPDPDGVAMTYADDRVVAVSHDGLRADVRARGFDMIVDEPRSAGGSEAGPTPYDYLTSALASCTVLTMRMYAERKGWPIEEIRAEVSHAKVHAADCEACEHADGDIGVLTRTITMTGDLDDDQRTRMMRIADRCPVHRTLEGQIEVRTTLR